MATATNDITGDLIATRGANSEAYRAGWERIFGKKQVEELKINLNDGEYWVKVPDDVVQQLGWKIGTKVKLAVAGDQLIVTSA